MATYDSAINAADGLIRRKGRAVTLTRTTAGTFNPVTQAETGAVTTTHAFRAVGLPPGKSAEFRVGSLVGRNVVELHMAQKGQTVRPSPGDAVTWDAASWTIFWSRTYDPAGDGAIYTLAYAER